MKKFTLLALVFTVLSFSAKAQPGNWIATADGNPSFEGWDGVSNLYWWHIQGPNATRSATNEIAAQDGSLSLKVVVSVKPTNDYDIQVISDRGPYSLTMGTSYTLRWWARGALGGESINTAVQQGPSGGYQGHYSGTGSLNTFWTQYTQTFNADATAMYDIKFNFGTGVGTFYVDNVEFGLTSSILPVDLIAFQANAKNKTVGLNWQVADEKRIKTYSIERSAEGQKFLTIGSVEAKNSISNSSYAFNDENPLKGMNYYRLKINEEDGTFNYSKVQSVRTSASSKALIYPNPTSDYIQVKNMESVESINIYDISGRLVRQFLNNTASQLDISELPKGVYQVAIKANGETEFSRVVKM
jgi:Secretion system C-terminal sorting domain